MEPVAADLEWGESRVFCPVAIPSADSNKEPILFLGQGTASLPVNLLEDFIHPPFFGGLARHPPLAAKLGAAAAPPLERALPIRPDLRRATFETGVTFREIVAEDAGVEVTPFFQHPRFAADQD